MAQLLRSNPAAGQAFCAFLVGRLTPTTAGRPLASRGDEDCAALQCHRLLF